MKVLLLIPMLYFGLQLMSMSEDCLTFSNSPNFTVEYNDSCVLVSLNIKNGYSYTNKGETAQIEANGVVVYSFDLCGKGVVIVPIETIE